MRVRLWELGLWRSGRANLLITDLWWAVSLLLGRLPLVLLLTLLPMLGGRSILLLLRRRVWSLGGWSIQLRGQ